MANSLNEKFNYAILMGIGIGLILGALFFLLIPQGQLSDEEIIAKAQELGMVTAEEVTEQINQLSLQENESPENLTEQSLIIEVNIPSGSNSNQVSKILYEQGIITNEEDFKSLVDLLGVSDKIRAGSHHLQQNNDLGETLLIITGIK